MPQRDEPVSALTEHRALLLPLACISLALGWILLPFYGAILWAIVIALLFTPLFRWLLPRLKRQRTLAALLALLGAVVTVVVPVTLILASLSHEAATVYENIKSGALEPTRLLGQAFAALPEGVIALLDQFGLARFDLLQRRLEQALMLASQFMASQALSIGQNTFEFVAGIFISLYLAFYFIRDGDGLMRDIRHAIPLSATHKRALFAKFGTVIRATVKGSLLVAAIQGLLGGLAFWALGLKWALLCGVLMGFLSLLPAVGAALVWLPVASYLLLNGAVWQGLMLAAYGVFVIGLVDNVLRPVLVGKEARLPDYVVMITTLGGIAVFGINGLILGPTIAVMFIALWHLYLSTRPDGH